MNSAGDESARFFRDSMEQLVRSAAAILAAAGEPISVQAIHAVIDSAPEMVIPEEPSRQTDEMRAWMEESYLGGLLDRIAERRIRGELSDDVWRAAEYGGDYFCKKWPALAPQTRTSIEATFSSMASKLLAPPYDRLLCGGRCSYTHEQMYIQGKIIILDLPTVEHGVSAELLQIANKLAAQGVIVRRDIKRYPRPCFIYADEFQVFSIPQDASFQEICRESRGCVFYATQNLQNVARRLQEHKAGSGTYSLIGNIQNRIFLQNGESEDTNRWAAEQFGKQHESVPEMHSGGISVRQDYRYLVEPATFASLPTPTKDQPFAVGVCYRGGQPWAETQQPYLMFAFPRL